MLSMTKVELELVSEPDMYLFFEKGMRVFLFLKHSIYKSISKIQNTNDPKQESKHVIYLDGNNLYGYLMSKFLRTVRFKRIQLKLKKVAFWKLIVNILKYYKNYTMIIL